jgi:hypothetical protein
MNDQQLDKKVRKDAAQVKKDLNILVKDSAIRFNRLVDNVGQNSGKTREDLSSRMEDGIVLLSKGIEKLTGDARDTMAGTVSSVKKDVGHGLRQYNVKAQKIANRVTGRNSMGFGKQAIRTTILGIVLALGVGFVLGSFLKPGRQSQM